MNSNLSHVSDPLLSCREVTGRPVETRLAIQSRWIASSVSQSVNRSCWSSRRIHLSNISLSMEASVNDNLSFCHCRGICCTLHMKLIFRWYKLPPPSSELASFFAPFLFFSIRYMFVSFWNNLFSFICCLFLSSINNKCDVVFWFWGFCTVCEVNLLTTFRKQLWVPSLRVMS